MTTFKKDPNANIDYTFDWTAYLTPLSDTIASVIFVGDPGLTVSRISFNTLTATCYVAGGQLNSNLNLRCQITTTAGRVDDRSITLKIVTRT